MEEIKITWFQNDIAGKWNTKPKGEMKVLEALERIRAGANREIIERIRILPDKPDRDKEKFWLPAMTFAGIFSPTRANKNLLQASGLACLDIDHHTDAAAYRDYLVIEKDYILTAWISPSGDGVKALARIPVVKDDAEYKTYYKALLKELEIEETDNTTDISRLCYESYDPEIKIKDFDKVSIFDKQIPNNTHADPTTSSTPDKVSDNIFNPILAKLGGRGMIYKESNRNNFIYAFACETNRAGIPENEVLEYTLVKFSEKDQQETTKTIASIKGAYERNNNEFGKELSDDLCEMEAMAVATRIDIDSPRPDEPYILSIGVQPVASLGSFSIITGYKKSRKTHYTCFLAALALNGNIGNHLVELPLDKKTVLFFDTEQSKGEAWDAMQKIVKTAGKSNAINLQYFSLRPYTVEEREKFINHILAITPNIGCVFIDGVRDLVTDINNTIEATHLFTILLRWSGEYNIHIFCIIHLNKSDGKIRGQIGSELENKAQSIIKVTKPDGDVPYSIVSFESGRGKGFNDYAIGYDENGLPIIVDIEEIKPAKPGRKSILPQDMPLNDHQNKLSIIFKDSAGLGYGELQKEVCEVYGIGETKAVTFITYFISEKLTYKEKGKYYFKPIHQAKDINREDEIPTEINKDVPF